MKKHRQLLIKCAGILIFAALMVAFYACPMRYFLGIPCPGCGLTTAFFAALRFDFKTAFQSHPLFLLVGVETAYALYLFLFPGKYRLNKKLELFVMILTFVLLMAVWIYRVLLINI